MQDKAVDAPVTDAPNTDIQPDIADHRTPDHKARQGLRYPYGDAVPDGGQVIALADGLYWARIPLPWSLDHINVYLFDEGDKGWTLVDTGSYGDRGKACWTALEETVLDGRPIWRIIATHMHPDHLGLAGWLQNRHDSQFVMTQAEYLMANYLWLTGAGEMPEADVRFLLKNGLPADYEAVVRGAGYDSFKKGVARLPVQYERMEDGSTLTIGGRRWTVVIGRGHSPEHACLLCLDAPLFIAGDQVLPEITSNVSVYAREPMANPMAHWVASLDRMRGLPGDPVVLPSHGPVFTGLHARLDRLIDGHLDKLARLHVACGEKPRSAVSAFGALYRRKITGFDFFLALGESIAHLHALESIGLVDRHDDDGVYRFTAKGQFENDAAFAALTALPGVALPPLGAL